MFVRLDAQRSLQNKGGHTPDELLASILDAAGCIKKREDKLRGTTRDLRTPHFWHHNCHLGFSPDV
jgi:hypothetical protein